MSNSSCRAVLKIGDAARVGDALREPAREPGFDGSFVRCDGREGEDGEGTTRSSSDGAAP